jgi:DNA-binding PadR family transcriptional regulator
LARNYRSTLERALDRLGWRAVQSIIDISMIGGAMPKRKLDPLPAAAFQILLSLSGRDLHGYAIMRQVEEQTAGKVRLGPGTLYSSIQALLEERLIEEVEAAQAPSEDGSNTSKDRRRLYRLTASGRKVARTEAERLADILRVARAKKILRGEYV